MTDTVVAPLAFRAVAVVLAFVPVVTDVVLVAAVAAFAFAGAAHATVPIDQVAKNIGAIRAASTIISATAGLMIWRTTGVAMLRTKRCDFVTVT